MRTAEGAGYTDGPLASGLSLSGKASLSVSGGSVTS